jgi:large subunit ribosomal protein L5
MRAIRLDKVVVNIGTGVDQQLHANARKLLELVTERKPADEISKKRIPGFKTSKGQKIGTFVTLRGAAAKKLAARLFDAVNNRVGARAVTDNSVNFGIREYIDISGVKYDPKIGMMGMNVNLSFKRAGMRIESKKRHGSKVPKYHKVIKADELRDYIKKEFNVSGPIEGGEQGSSHEG